MKPFKAYILEQSDYDKAWDDSQEDFAHLKANGYESVAKTSGDRGVHHVFSGKVQERGDDSYRGQVHFHHDNYDRKHTGIKTTFGYVKHEATPDSTVRKVVDEKSHKTIKDAVAHLASLNP